MPPSPLLRYARWLHLDWPAGTVEKLPLVGPDGRTSVPGLFIAGDLTGVPLLKFALDSGARAARTIAAELAAGDPGRRAGPALVIVGAGVAGMAAALEARRLGLAFDVLEASAPFATLADFPARKPIFTLPQAMTPAGPLQVSATVKEDLLAELRAQVQAAGIVPRPARVERIVRTRGALGVQLAGGEVLHAARVLLAIGRSGDFRRLGVPGEDGPRVHHRLHDPADFAGRAVLVVGGGDTALETARALALAGAAVTLAHRDAGLPRPGPASIAALRALQGDGPGRIAVRASTRVTAIGERDATLAGAQGSFTAPAEAVFTCIGRHAPLALLRRSGVAISGDFGPRARAGLALMLLFCAWLCDWKSGGFFAHLGSSRHWFPANLPGLLAGAGGSLPALAADPRTLAGTLAISAASPSFWTTLVYSLVVFAFGLRRIRRRATPYVTAQTWTLIAVQVLPLFLLPEIVLPLLGHNGLLPRPLADALFPTAHYGHGREYWRAYGFVLAWPLDVYNVLTDRPLGAWLAIGFVQTFVLIPLLVLKWGKGAYCGWICSCGALAETLGDTHRQRMPHGPASNRLNLAGQVLLAVAVLMLLVRVAGWLLPPGNPVAGTYDALFMQPWKWIVDVFLAGVVGLGVYFAFSGRVWCRFFCPLAAWMNVIARYSRFAIAADKPRCISCSVCTSVCHMGIDVMATASRGLPMRDPQCVRCSACVQSCPTGVLQFGELGADGTFVRLDSLRATPAARPPRA